MSLDRSICQGDLTRHKEFNEAEFVQKVLTSGQKSQVEKLQEYLV